MFAYSSTKANNYLNALIFFFCLASHGIKKYKEIGIAADLARRILLCKTSSDATVKLFYSLPFLTSKHKWKDKDRGTNMNFRFEKITWNFVSCLYIVLEF